MPADPIDLKPFSPLPLELKGEILSHCDASTLAKASAASLAFLELASRLLYNHITFVGPEGLTKFLTLRADVQVPSLAPYLDLSLVQSVTYIDIKGHYFETGIVCTSDADHKTAKGRDPGDIFVPCRLLPPGAPGPVFTPLSLYSLNVQLVYDTDTDSALWLFFDPVVARIEGTPARSAKEALVFYGPDLSRWTRLQELLLVDAVTERLLFHEGLPVGPVGLTYELSTDDTEASTVSFVVEDAHGLVDDDGNPTSFIGQVVIQVTTERMKTVFLAQLSDSPLFDRTTVVVKPAPTVASASATGSLPTSTA